MTTWEVAVADGRGPVIVALGDSLTAGWGLGSGEAWPEVAAGMLAESGCPVRMVNAGVSGDTSAGGRSRLDWALGESPDVVVVALGANDGLRGLPPERMEENLRAIIAGARAKGAQVLLAGMLASPSMGREYKERYDAVFPKLAKEQGTLFQPFLLEGVATDPSLNQGDGLHPNAAGARLIAERLLPLLRRLAGCGG